MPFGRVNQWTEGAGACLHGYKMTEFEDENWHAIRVRSRCEKLAESDLTDRGFHVFAAKAPQRRVWADRVRVVEMPLFPGYIFGKFRASQCSAVESAAGVASVVRFGKQDAPVDAREIDCIKLLIGSGVEVMRSPLLRVGSPVCVRYGPLKGVRGLLTEVKDRHQLVVTVSILQRSVAVEIDEALVEPLRHPVLFSAPPERSRAGMAASAGGM